MSTMSDRDRKALTWGGLGVAAILLFNYLLSPVWKHWSESSDRLASRDAFVASFRERLEAHDSLRTRRDVLALRLGSLRVLHVKEETEPDDKAPAKEGEKAPESVTAKAENGAKTDESASEKPVDTTIAEKADGGKMSESSKTAADTPPGEKKDGEPPSITPPRSEETPNEEAPIAVAKNTSSAGETPTGDSAIAAENTKKDNAPDSPEDKEGEKAATGETGKTNAEDKKEGTPDAAKEEAKKDKKSEKSALVAVPVIEASSLATYVEKTAKAAKIKIKRITPKKNSSGKKRTKYFEPVTLQVNFECQVTNLVQLLHDLEKGELFVRVDKVEITRDVAQGDKLNASLDLSSYEPIKDLS